MKNKYNEIIYIGKAKNLYQRVKSYFYKSQNRPPKILRLINELETINFLATTTELQALLLESKLIKTHLPKYNRQIRNYKNYPFIKINLTNEYPRLYVTKKLALDDDYYFGPFNDSQSLSQEVNLLNKIFKLRTCKHNIKFNPRQQSCFYKEINQCTAPCNGQITKSNYKMLIESVIHFFNIGESAIVNEYVNKKNNLISNLQFEQAQKHQEDIELLEKMKKQYLRLSQTLTYSNSILLFQEDHLYISLIIAKAIIKETHHINKLSDFIHLLKQSLKKYHIPGPFLFPNFNHYQLDFHILKKEHLDEMKIITSWVQNHQKQCFILPFNQINRFLFYINNNKETSLSSILSHRFSV